MPSNPQYDPSLHGKGNAGFPLLTGSNGGWRLRRIGILDAIVFIDGNNLYHNAKAMGIKPGNIDFEKLVDFACSRFSCNRKWVHYYNSIPDISDGADNYYRQQSFFSGLAKLKGFTVKTRKLQKQSNQKEITERIRFIDGEDYCPKCRPMIEKMCADCIGRITKKEKGVDVAIAIDMLNLCAIRNECDMCLLISGDADFIPALDIIVSKGRSAASMFFYRGYSYDLRQKHRHYIVRDSDVPSIMTC